MENEWEKPTVGKEVGRAKLFYSVGPRSGELYQWKAVV